MRRRGKRVRKLLDEHFNKVGYGLDVKFIPITDEADNFWEQTGICTSCHRQALSGTICKKCGCDHSNLQSNIMNS